MPLRNTQQTSQTGIVYRLTGDPRRRMVAHYHGKPEPVKHDRTPYRVDIAGLRPIQQQQALRINGSAYESRFTIGFEVEKNSFDRSAVREYELFCGFESDSSCGYEAVTNVLPLMPAGAWRTKVFDMMFKAEAIIDDRFSPSDGRCSCHTTVTVKGMGAEDIVRMTRLNMAIIMALYPKRLWSHYCNGNLTMLPQSRYNEMFDGSGYNRGSSNRYQFAHVRSFPDRTQGVEFRSPARMQSVKQMMRRYELFYEILNFSINRPDGTFNSLLGIVRPIILSMYNGDVEKTTNVIRLAIAFRKFIDTGKVNKAVQPFVDPEHLYCDRWERGMTTTNCPINRGVLR